MQRGARDHRGRWGLLARLSVGIGAAGIAVGVLGCSLILDWSDFTASSGQIDWDAQIVNEGGANIVADSGVSDSVDGESLADVFSGPRCVPSPPAGWTGPVALYLGAAGSQIPSCGSDYPVPLFDGYAGLNAPPASCSPKCTCGTPEGGSCIPPDFTAYTDPFCQSPCGSPVAITYDTCSAPPSCAFTFFKVSAPGINAGTCTASVVSSNSAQATWSRVTRACGLAAPPSSGSCKADEVWVPFPRIPFPRLCIMNSGKVDCPNSAYSQATTLYSTDAVVDTRGCSDCTCAPPADSSCSTQATSMMAAGVAYDSMCRPQLAQAFTVPTNGCQPLWTPGVQPSNLKLIQPLTLIPGSCAPGGGQPMGTVTPMGSPMTVCCTMP